MKIHFQIPGRIRKIQTGTNLQRLIKQVENDRQIDVVKHNLGLEGSCGVPMYKKRSGLGAALPIDSEYNDY